MANLPIKDHLVNIKSFQTYLEHIVSSIENNRYHQETIQKLSGYITEYYKKINEGDSDSDEQSQQFQGTSDNNDVEIIDSGDDSDSVISGLGINSTSDTTNSETSDDDEDDENIYLESFVANSKPVKPVKADKFLTEFSERNIDNKEFMIYKKNPNFLEIQENYLEQINTY
tara:strand:+ start:54 stop:566 length:513 start_codon:yes stop_codon:yes gene_type:complete